MPKLSTNSSEKAPVSPRKINFNVAMDFGDRKVRLGKGDSVLEALQNVKRPVKIVGKTFVEVWKGKKRMERMFMPVEAKRLFYPNAQVYIAKQLEYLMK